MRTIQKTMGIRCDNPNCPKAEEKSGGRVIFRDWFHVSWFGVSNDGEIARDRLHENDFCSPGCIAAWANGIAREKYDVDAYKAQQTQKGK